MNYLPEKSVFNFPPDTLEAVRKIYELHKPGVMNQLIDILEYWIKKQKHFTKKEFSREYLERIIITNKGSVERAKNRLDKLFTMRTLMPHFFKDYNVLTDFESLRNIVTYVLLPTLTKDYERVYLFKVVGKKFSSQMYLDGYRFFFLLSEYAYAHDYASGYSVVIDYRDASVTDIIANANIQELREAITAQVDGYGVRIKSIHFITESKLVDAVIAIAKQVLSEKISKRIHCHKQLDTVFDYVPKSVFPKDYGGNEKPLMEIHADWMKVLSSQKFMEHWQRMNSARTEESLRQKDRFNDRYLGMAGTFRTLSLD